MDGGSLLGPIVAVVRMGGTDDDDDDEFLAGEAVGAPLAETLARKVTRTMTA